MLNEVQKQVAGHSRGPLLVIAGAGTGKTRTLTHRYASLIQNGIDPEKILLLTFTRKAAGEMQQRASLLLKNQGLPELPARSGGTFHSVAFKWLINLNIASSGFAIVEDKDLKSLIKIDLTDEQKSELAAAGLDLSAVLQIRSLAVNLQCSIQEVMAQFYSSSLLYIESVNTILERLETVKNNGGMYDFDDILQEFLNVLKSPKGNIIRTAYEFVMVDEYQDTSRVQVEILRELVRAHGNIMAVGDDCQSIYSFRGALADQMRDFDKDFEGADIVKLEHNYRSSQEILDICNDVISESTGVFPKQLQSAENKKGARPVLIQANDDEDAASQIIDKIIGNLSQGIPLNEQAVLFRSSMQAMSLERRLLNLDIAYRKYGGVKITQAAHTRDFLSIISCCFCKNSASWLRVLKMLPGVGLRTAAKALKAVEKGDIANFKFPAKSCRRADELLKLVLSEPEDCPNPLFIDDCLDWYKTFLFMEYDNANARLYELKELILQLLKVNSLNEFAADILLNSLEEDDDQSESSLVLSTIHSAKGKEWDCVYILNVADGAIPLKRPSINFEEERRLLYVAMTRAREELVLYWPLYGTFSKNKLSPFLKVLDGDAKSAEYNPYMINDSDEPDDLLYVYDDSGIF